MKHLSEGYVQCGQNWEPLKQSGNRPLYTRKHSDKNASRNGLFKIVKFLNVLLSSQQKMTTVILKYGTPLATTQGGLMFRTGLNSAASAWSYQPSCPVVFHFTSQSGLRTHRVLRPSASVHFLLMTALSLMVEWTWLTSELEHRASL